MMATASPQWPVIAALGRLSKGKQAHPRREMVSSRRVCEMRIVIDRLAPGAALVRVASFG